MIEIMPHLYEPGPDGQPPDYSKLWIAFFVGIGVITVPIVLITLVLN